MRNYLLHEDLWFAVTGYPEGDTTPQAIRVKYDTKALAKICLTVDGAAITHVRSAKTASEAWKSLQKAFDDNGIGRRIALERKLYRLSLADYADIEQYINAVTSTAQDLADIGKVIEDTSIAAILLGGLTPKYEPLIMSLLDISLRSLVFTRSVVTSTLQFSSAVDLYIYKKYLPISSNGFHF